MIFVAEQRGEPMSELIDRQKAIDTLANMHCKSDEDGYVWIIRSDAWARIDALPTAQPERSSEIQDILEYLDTVLHPIISPDHWNVYSELHDMISMLPSAQPETTTMILGTDEGGVRLWYKCSSCGEPCVPDDNYCSCCGRRFINNE